MINNKTPEIETKKIFIVAITIPTPSTKYIETSCTAGIDEEGNWIRMYPIPLRMLELTDKKACYRKYEWIQVELSPSSNDKRPESRKCQLNSIKRLGIKIDTKDNWRKRKEIVLHSKTGVYYDFDKLLKDADKNNIKVSLAVFKPTKVLDCKVEKRAITKIETELTKQEKIMSSYTPELFDDDKEFIQAKPMLLDVQYIFEDCNKKQHKMGIIDWEVYELFRRYYDPKQPDTLELAKEMILTKYRDDFINKKDLYFILGTRKEDHLKGFGHNPFSIIGVFFPKMEQQNQLEFDFLGN